MGLIPESEFNERPTLNLAPMVDFLFLVVAVFALIAVTKTSLFDSEIQLATVSPESAQIAAGSNKGLHTVNISLNEEGKFKWITEKEEYLLTSPEQIGHELEKMVIQGSLPQNKEKTTVLLHIDRNARWEPIVDMVFAIKESGYEIHPVYEAN